MPRGTCRALIKDYCANCSFAGVHFIADETKHWIERLLWIILVFLSWYGSALLIIAAWDAFVASPISFGLETTYLNWDTKMPAVAICESSNDNRIFEVSDEIWPPDHLLDLEDCLKDISYFRGVSYSIVDVCFTSDDPDPLCPKDNFREYVRMVRSDCDKVIKNCSYNDEEFPCCEYFQPINTDFGPCFIINSIQSKKPSIYPMISNLKNKRGILKIEVWLPSMMYTIGDDEVPTITSLQSSSLKLLLGHYHRRLVSVRNIENDPQIVHNTIEQRACRFHNENEDGVYPHYSYSACTVQCRKKGQLDLCGCNDHFMVGADDSEVCNLTGLACLHQHYMDLTTLKPEWDLSPGLACNCLPSCDETEITVIKDIDNTVKGKANKKKARVEVILAYLATERFKRNVVRSRMDLVVSVGGTTGLFVGASLLSFVELIFYFTIRYISNILIERRRLQNNSGPKPVIIPEAPRLSNVEEANITDNNSLRSVKPLLTSKFILTETDFPSERAYK